MPLLKIKEFRNFWFSAPRERYSLNRCGLCPLFSAFYTHVSSGKRLMMSCDNKEWKEGSVKRLARKAGQVNWRVKGYWHGMWRDWLGHLERMARISEESV